MYGGGRLTADDASVLACGDLADSVGSAAKSRRLNRLAIDRVIEKLLNTAEKSDRVEREYFGH